MSTPYLGEIRTFSFAFAPEGWAFCNGQILPISQNAALFSLLGTTYGGNGTSTFALPNLQGSMPMHTGAGFLLGQAGGEAQHTLTVAEYPSHSHSVNGQAGPRDVRAPADAILASGDIYGLGPPTTTALAAQAIAPTGGGLAHPNLQPYATVNMCIALTGIFPPRS
jgi:microcystin-dependent protein